MAEFDKLLDNREGLLVAYIAYGGIALTYEGLTEKQKLMFINQMNKLGMKDASVAATLGEYELEADMGDMYLRYVHLTPLRYPRYICVVDGTGVVYEGPIGYLDITLGNIAEKVKDRTIYLYNIDEEKELLRAQHICNVLNGKELATKHCRFSSLSYMVVGGLQFDTFDDYLVLLGDTVDTGEMLCNYADMLVHHEERLKVSVRRKAEALYTLSKLV
jgi:hypothetical protein